MKIIFFGTSIFAVPSLKSLASSGHEILLVVTQPDRKKGRNLKLAPPVIKDIAGGLKLPVYQPAKVSGGEAVERLKGLEADLFVVVSFGQLLSEEVLATPKKFSINLHASLLPKYRGAAPINWAIINGEKRTGISIFRLEKEMDSGDIILDKELAIDEGENALKLGERLSHIGADLLVEAIDLIESGRAVFKKQDNVLVTFAPKLKKSDGRLDWGLKAVELHNRVRGLFPWPAAFTSFKGMGIKILETSVEQCEHNGNLGQVCAIRPKFGLLVNTKEGCLAIKTLQPEGSRVMDFEEFLRGHKLVTGDVFDGN